MKVFKILLITILMIGFTISVSFSESEKMMSITVKEGQIRSTPSFTGKIITRLSYGDQVSVVEEKGSWRKVSVPGSSNEGWIHSSSLSNKKLSLKAGSSSAGGNSVSQKELALAGKGFNKRVENEFKNKNPNLDFSMIDKMEKIVVSEDEIQEFIKEGELNPEEGQ